MTTTAIQNGFCKSPQKAAGETMPQIGETNFRVINKFKEMYGEATAILADWLNVSKKTAGRKMNLERTLHVEELGRMLRDERGYEVLDAIMGNAQPKWWRVMVPLMDAANARQMQLEARRRLQKTIESALDADKHLSATIRYAEALQDQDFAGNHIDALRSMARVQNRAVARKQVSHTHPKDPPVK